MASRLITQPRQTSSPRVWIHILALGPLDNLVYLIEDRASGHAALIDPAWAPAEIARVIEERDLLLTDILITHGHDDHVNGLAALVCRFCPRIHVMAEEARYWLKSTPKLGQQELPSDRDAEIWAAPPPDDLILHTENAAIEFGTSKLEIIPTPGHSPGSACYRMGEYLFSGDTLFVYGCGRCDLPGSDARRMFHSLERLKQRTPGYVTVLPGHRYARALDSSMAEQRRANPFLHFDDPESFIAFRAEHNKHRLPPYEPVPRGHKAW